MLSMINVTELDRTMEPNMRLMMFQPMNDSAVIQIGQENHNEPGW